MSPQKTSKVKAIARTTAKKPGKKPAPKARRPREAGASTASTQSIEATPPAAPTAPAEPTWFTPSPHFSPAVLLVPPVTLPSPELPEPVPPGAKPMPEDLQIMFREYQRDVFWNFHSKTMIILWSRQIGKSYTLAGWAVKRLLENPGRLVTVLSNSRENGAEFVLKCHEAVRMLGHARESVETESNQAELDQRTDLSEDLKYEAMRFEVRITVKEKVGRIKVLAANPRTARGFSGDLIMDEFAFHEDSRAIWEAAEPIISSNPDFLCRIASTGNGRNNMFYQLVSEHRIPCSRVRRSDAWATGELKIYSAVDGSEITPDEARRQSSDKRAYDQNYECAFEDENMPLLTQELINAAQRPGPAIDRQEWSAASLERLANAEGELFVGQDFARVRDLSVQIVLEKIGATKRMAGMLIMENMRTPDQQRQLDLLAELPKFHRAALDMTGNGLGLYEYAQEKHGAHRIEGVNFSSTEPVSRRIQSEGRKGPKARVTEIMAADLVGEFEDRAIEIFEDADLRDDLRKPEKIVSPGGSVSIAASRTAEGHADRFWALALAVRASRNTEIATMPRAFRIGGQRMAVKHNRSCVGV